MTRPNLLTVLSLHCIALVVVAGFVPSAAGAPRPKQDQQPRPAVILISIDGLKPEYVLEADGHGLKIPNFRHLVRDGTYSTGVHGIVPTVTYPSHTTLLTGVSPAKHGIYANNTFDPLRKNFGGWYWYAEDIKVPTLWDAAAEAGLTTANVHWPVSVAARITWNLPQYWRAGTPDDRKLLRVLATAGLLDVLEKDLGPYADGIDETITGDEIRAKFAARLIELKRPAFTTIYLTALDHEQHATGPFSPESITTLERIDTALGGVLDSIKRTYGESAVVCVVSDHGFVRTDKSFNLAVAFRKEGLIEIDDKNQIKSWKATIWGAGGSEAIILHDKNDAATKARVADLLAKLAADPANGIDRIVPEEELHNRGGFPDAIFLVALRPGFVTGEGISGDLVTASTYKGMHGYWPDVPDMNSSFFIMGPGWVPHSVGQIDMRAIAPTLATILGVKLPAAEGRAILPLISTNSDAPVTPGPTDKSYRATKLTSATSASTMETARSASRAVAQTVHP
jgi:predicted AlkP superfamily pyrophosphatase or phosphodiesterase